MGESIIQEKIKQSQELSVLIKKYLDNGGKITRAKMGESGKAGKRFVLGKQ